MSLAAPPPTKQMTAEALMAMPDDGIDRELIRGELREKRRIFATPRESCVQATVTSLLMVWLMQQPKPRGEILSGGAPFRLIREPITFVGIDVAYASADQAAATRNRLEFVDGPPVLAVEVVAPSDTHGGIAEKVNLYLEVGSVLWLVDPDLSTITVHRPGQVPKMLTTHDELACDPELPGFKVSVAEVFDD
jgi:Uma2 family endonuclease